MLPPLNPVRMAALAREGDPDPERVHTLAGSNSVDEIVMNRVSDIRSMIKEDNDWGSGVKTMLVTVGGIPAYIRRTKDIRCVEDRLGSYDWYLVFSQYGTRDQFRDLGIWPGPGGVVDIRAFGKCLKSFQIIGCRKNWPALVRWIWEYGNQVEIRRLKQEVREKSRRQRRRAVKSLLTRVLCSKKFKAQYAKESAAMDSVAIANIVDVIMDDVDATRPPYDAAPDTAISSGPDTKGEQNMPIATVEDVKIGALGGVDQDT